MIGQKNNNFSTAASPISKESIKKSGSPSEDEKHVARCVKSEISKPLPASVSKPETQSAYSSDKSSKGDSEYLLEFRIVYLSILASVFEFLACPSLEEDEE